MKPEAIFENRELEPGVVAGKSLSSSSAHLIYEAADGSGIIRVWNVDSGDPHMIANRHREAMFLSHPNLIQCLRTGVIEHIGENWCYAVYEPYDSLLTELLSAGPATLVEAHDLAAGLTAPLEYLHSQNFVYCHLDPHTVARRGDRWLLCDYSQLRLSGTGYASETRRLLARIPSTPPEAFQGYVTPAWDAWSLAHVTRAALLGPRPRRFSNERPAKPDTFPEPFETMINSCSASNPGARCSMSDIARLLEQRPSEGTAVASAPAVVRDAPPEAPKSDAEIRQRVVIRPREPFRPEDAEPERQPRSVPTIVWAALALATLALLFIVLGRDGRSRAASEGSPTASASGTTPTAAPAASAAATEPALPDATEPAAANTRGRTSDHSEISRVVQGWASEFRQGDLTSHLRYYAPKVDRLFRARNVDKNFVRKVKQESLSPAAKVRRYELSDIKTELPDDDLAVVTFDKTYEIAGRNAHSGKVRSELRLRRMADGWRIVSERDTRVYWQRKS